MKVVFAPLMAVALISYFAFHLINGDRGLLAYRDLGLALQQAEALHAQTQQEREQLEHRVSLLRPESLDLDMVEERARILLDMARPDDVVVLENSF